MPAIIEESQTMYLVTELAKSLFPAPIDGKVLLARQRPKKGKVYKHRAAVVEQHHEGKMKVHMDTGMVKNRGQALDTLLSELEDLAEERLNEVDVALMDEELKRVMEADENDASTDEAVHEEESEPEVAQVEVLKKPNKKLVAGKRGQSSQGQEIRAIHRRRRRSRARRIEDQIEPHKQD
jgi:hypothetical protein